VDSVPSGLLRDALRIEFQMSPSPACDNNLHWKRDVPNEVAGGGTRAAAWLVGREGEQLHECGKSTGIWIHDRMNNASRNAIRKMLKCQLAVDRSVDRFTSISRSAAASVQHPLTAALIIMEKCIVLAVILI